MDQKLKDTLPQLTLATLHQVDRGALNRQFNRKFAAALQDISEFPVRNGKPEPREITIKITITPEIAQRKKAIEGPMGVQEVDIPEVVGLRLQAVVKDKMPVFQTSDVSFVVDNRNGRIADARFNPENPSCPNQLEMPFDDEDRPDE